MTDLTELTGLKAAELIRKREISSVELTKACLERINQRNQDVGAWCHIDEEFSLSQAQIADASEPKSLLHGVPFGVKDVIDTKDFPTEYGSKIYKGRQPTRDADCVTLMRDAGAVLLGKCVTTEFAMFTPNQTRNPYNLAHTAGGSSSGTGAAVGDNTVPIAYGNQTAGSLIRPAAYCGVYGLKPTHGLGEGAGVMQMQPLFDTLGYMGRSIEDLQVFFGIATKTNQTREWKGDRNPRIGICRTYQWDSAQSESRKVLEETMSQLASQGVEVEYFDLPPEYAGLVETHRTVLYKGLSLSLAEPYEKYGDQLSDGLHDILAEGRSICAETYAAEYGKVQSFRAKVNDTFSHYDAILCPSAPGEAPAGMATGSPIFQVTWTLLGVPCLNLPVATGPQGLPVGVQLIGRRHDDANLLAIGKEIMNRISTFCVDE